MAPNPKTSDDQKSDNAAKDVAENAKENQDTIKNNDEKSVGNENLDPNTKVDSSSKSSESDKDTSSEATEVSVKELVISEEEGKIDQVKESDA